LESPAPVLQNFISLPAGDGESNVESVRAVINVHEAERFSRTILIGATNSNASRYWVAYGPTISTFDYAEAADLDRHAIWTHQRNGILSRPRLDLNAGSDSNLAILEGAALEFKLFDGIRRESCSGCRLTLAGDCEERQNSNSDD